MKSEAKGKSFAEWKARLSDWYAYSCAAIIALMGLLMFYAASGEARRLMQLLNGVDAVTGFSNRTLLNGAGVIHLVLAVCLLAARTPQLRGMLTGWAGLNYLVYLFGMAWMKVASPLPCVCAVAMRADVAPATLDSIWKALIFYLLTGAGTIAWVEWRRGKALKDAAYAAQWRDYLGEVVVEKVKHQKRQKGNDTSDADADNVASKSRELKVACPNCGQHIRHEAGYAGNEVSCPSCKKSIKLFGTSDLKMSCFFCQGHIEFPAHAVGRKMPCPHCHKDITLIEPK